MKTTLGGDRIGTGKKEQVSLHNYGRSTFNLSKKIETSLAPGVLYPLYTNIGLRGDTFKIKIDAIARTLPTQGPLFGSFKLQIDCFTAPLRLYQGILHNNPINLGLNMNKVKLPKITVQTKRINDNTQESQSTNVEFAAFKSNSLLKYLGMSGLPQARGQKLTVERKFNATGVLAYYDIFKNYYANKQEEDAYVIGGNATYVQIEKMSSKLNGQNIIINEQNPYTINIKTQLYITTKRATELGKSLGDYIFIKAEAILPTANSATTLKGEFSLNEWVKLGMEWQIYDNIVVLESSSGSIFQITRIQTKNSNTINLIPFKLENIDEMRYRILSSNKLGDEINIDKNETLMPYAQLVKISEEGQNVNNKPMNGLVVKTYQSDIFNNWLNSEQIIGENGIAELTKVSTEGGAFTIDSLRLANKINNMLNRIVLSGGTYQDWQDAVYTENAAHIAESPIYWGGCSYDIQFEEVISTSETSQSPLGTLGGRGTLDNKKDGSVVIKLDEASIIMIMVSITPRIYYSQGNKWFNTEIDTVDDLHKPALDGIGFQDLITEQMAYWEAVQEEDGSITKFSAGKQLAWQNYRTDYDEVYGDFAESAAAAYMTLQRDYEKMWVQDRPEAGGEIIRIADLTTYIDPSKYNYAFAYNKLDAQNFWLLMVLDIEARRLMSASQIPNL